MKSLLHSSWGVEQKFPLISKCYRKSPNQTGLRKNCINHQKAQVLSKSLVDAMGTEFLLLPLLSTWWLPPLALHGGLWHSRLTHSQTEVPQKRRCVSFLEVPPKGLLYFSDSDWVISSPLNQSLCPESYNDLSSHLCIWHGINSVLNVYELSEEQVSTEVPIKENS